MTELRQQALGRTKEWRQKWAATASLCLGALALVGAGASMFVGESSLSPNLYWVAPQAIASVVLAVVSALRRERRLPWVALALVLSGTGLLIGWVAVIGLVALATALIIAILSQLL
jgi:hypothetical protein